ncbi:hypothetical protein Scep_021928 [Stephania cephalantha]|uniref:Uncharacterized protein n=1 Tax=Stephania cephalantha TaxID=152367 RepID=A0AAP0FFB7_9MAGN
MNNNFLAGLLTFSASNPSRRRRHNPMPTVVVSRRGSISQSTRHRAVQDAVAWCVRAALSSSCSRHALVGVPGLAGVVDRAAACRLPPQPRHLPVRRCCWPSALSCHIPPRPLAWLDS